jgi:hypothetical protein
VKCAPAKLFFCPVPFFIEISMAFLCECMYFEDVISERVTRLDDFSPIGRLFTFVQFFLKLKKLPTIFHG